MNLRKAAVHHPSHRDKQMVWDLNISDTNLAKIQYIYISCAKADAYKAAFDDAFVDIDIVRWAYRGPVSLDDPGLTPGQRARLGLLQGSSAICNDVKLADPMGTASTRNY